MEGHAEGSSGSRVITRSDDAPAFPPLDRHDPLMALGVSLLVRRLLVTLGVIAVALAISFLTDGEASPLHMEPRC